MSSFALVTGDFSQISSSDNQFGWASTGLGPNPLLSTQTFSEETRLQFTPSFHLPTMVDVSNLGLVTGPFGEPAPSVIGSVSETNHQPWDAQPQEQRGINGGTFIGGNLNYIHTTVLPAGRISIPIVILHFTWVFQISPLFKLLNGLTIAPRHPEFSMEDRQSWTKCMNFSTRTLESNIFMLCMD
jgi:hypothetical protein